MWLCWMSRLCFGCNTGEAWSACFLLCGIVFPKFAKFWPIRPDMEQLRSQCLCRQQRKWYNRDYVCGAQLPPSSTLNTNFVFLLYRFGRMKRQHWQGMWASHGALPVIGLVACHIHLWFHATLTYAFMPGSNMFLLSHSWLHTLPIFISCIRSKVQDSKIQLQWK